ncbi:MAG TPA: LysR family transcriptional regulator [Inquilinus sp.]|nr:LysR family transcriptional regulator [Inquilinus sp.]
MDRLRAYEVFVAVVAKGSFTRAAETLDTSPANVTRYVNELEAHLATRLLNRSSRRLSLTEAGEALVERARGILDEVAETEAIVSSAALSPRGRLRLNAPLSFGMLHLAPLWPRFLARYPEIELDVDLIDRVVDLVGEGYDLAVRISRVGSQALVGRKLAASRNIVCASPDYIARRGRPMTPQDLADHPCITYGDPPMTVWQFARRGEAPVGTTVSGAIMSNDGEVAHAAALAGAGVVLKSIWHVAEDLAAGRLVRILEDYESPASPLQAVFPSARHLAPKTRAFLDFLGAELRVAATGLGTP